MRYNDLRRLRDDGAYAVLGVLDRAEQERLRAAVARFPPDRVSSPDDLANWPRLRMTLLETLRLYPPVP